MATRRVTEPAKDTTVDVVTEPGAPDEVEATEPVDPRRLVHVYDANTGVKVDRPVPATFLDGRFPQLKEVPSKKEGR